MKKLNHADASLATLSITFSLLGDLCPRKSRRGNSNGLQTTLAETARKSISFSVGSKIREYISSQVWFSKKYANMPWKRTFPQDHGQKYFAPSKRNNSKIKPVKSFNPRPWKKIIPSYVYGMFPCHSCLLRAHGRTVDVLAAVRGGHCGPFLFYSSGAAGVYWTLFTIHQKNSLFQAPHILFFDTARP